MPLPLLLAMVLAFGLRLPTESRPLPPPELARRLAEAGLGVVVVGVVAAAFGRAVRRRVARSGGATPRARRLGLWATRLVGGLGLAVFCWTLAWLDWPRVVGWGLNLRDMALVEQGGRLVPFLASQIVAWLGLYAGEAALRPDLAGRGLGSYLLRKARQSFGMLLPVAILYAVGQEITRRGLPGSQDDPLAQLLAVGVISALVFVLAPAFIRLSWPMSRLEDGPLRGRLTRLARRLEFRYTDILVWDTGGLIINAGVTGALPWFRYVLITDAMIELLDDREIEAVFGHEVGHVAHRHFPYFALFAVGSMGLLSLGSWALAEVWDYEAALARWAPDPSVAEVIAATISLALLGLYFYAVFGLLSRRFERQADLFGCRAISCGREDCPPHFDPNDPSSPEWPPGATCQTGLNLFADALADVGQLNGMPASAWSWRHGSIARRIAFLRSLRGRPDLERRFRRRLALLQWSLGLVLTAASLAAIAVVAGLTPGP